MIHGLPNLSNNTNKKIPDSKKEEPISKVAHKVFEKRTHTPQNKSWSWKGFVVKKLYMETIDGAKDQKILKNIFGDTALLDNEIQEIAPFLRVFITEKVKNVELLGEAFRDNPRDVEEFVDHLIHHVILSAVLKTLSPEVQKKVKNGVPLHKPLHLKEVMAKFIKQTIEIFGNDFNEIDRRAMEGEPLDQLFRPFVEKLFDYLFPEGDSLRALVDSLSLPNRLADLKFEDTRTFQEKQYDYLATILAEFYQSLIGPSKAEDSLPSAGEKQVKDWFKDFLLESFISTSKNEDIQFFKNSGIPDPERFIRQISPKAAEYLVKFFPIQEPLAKEGADALLLHMLASIAKAAGKNPLNPDTLLEDVFSYLAGMVKEAIATHDLPNEDSFSETSIKIMALFIPPNQGWAIDFIKRRKFDQISSLNQLFYQMYRAEVGNQEEVGQLEALCNSLASRSLGKINEYLSNPEKLGQVLKGDEHSTQLISRLFSSKDPHLQWLGNAMVKTGGLTLFQGLTHFLEKIPQKEGEDQFYAAFETLFNLGATYLPEGNVLAFVEQLTGLFYTPQEQWTAGGALFEKVQEYIGEELTVAINYSNKLLGSKKENQEKLKALYGSDNPIKIGDLLRHMVLQGIPSALNVEADWIVEKGIIPYLGISQDNLESITRSLNKIGSKELLEKTGTVEFVSQLIEAAYLQFFLNFSVGIQKLEKKDEGPSLVEEMVMITLRGLSDHLKHLGEAKEAIKGSKSKKPKEEQIYDYFEKMKLLAPEIRNASANDEFYQKLANQLFRLFETDLKKELPEIAANLIENVMAPFILSSAVTQALDPATLHLMLASLLKKAASFSESNKIKFKEFFPASSEIKARLADKKARKERAKEQYQKDIADVLSELIKNAVYLQPGSFVRKIGEKDGLRAEIAGGIADTWCQSLRKERDLSQALFFLNKVMEFIQEAFPTPDFTGIIHKTLDEKAKAEEDKKIEVEKAMKKLPKYLMKHIHLATKNLILGVFFKFWYAMEEKIQKALPIIGLVINYILNALIKVPLTIVFAIIDIFLNILNRAFVRVLLTEPSKNIASTVQHAALRNLVYDVSHRLFFK